MFVHVISRRDKLPDWECLWSDFTQEDLRLSLVNGTTSSSGKGLKVEKENVALAWKRKAKKVPNQGQDSKGEKKKKDLPKVKCFRCSQLGHYVSQYLKRKKDKKGK